MPRMDKEQKCVYGQGAYTMIRILPKGERSSELQKFKRHSHQKQWSWAPYQ